MTETRRLAEKSATRGKGPSTEPSCGSRRAQLTSEFVMLVEQLVTKENKFISIKEMALRGERERGAAGNAVIPAEQTAGHEPRRRHSALIKLPSGSKQTAKCAEGTKQTKGQPSFCLTARGTADKNK